MIIVVNFLKINYFKRKLIIFSKKSKDKRIKTVIDGWGLERSGYGTVTDGDGDGKGVRIGRITV